MVISTNEENLPNKFVDLFLSWLHARYCITQLAARSKIRLKMTALWAVQCLAFLNDLSRSSDTFFSGRIVSCTKIKTPDGCSILNLTRFLRTVFASLCSILCFVLTGRTAEAWLLCDRACGSISKRKAQDSTKRFASRHDRGTIFLFSQFS